MHVQALKQMFVLQLDHGNHGKDYPKSPLTMVVTDFNKDGDATRRIVQKQIPDSITWQPGETKTVPASVAQLGQFQNAIRLGLLRVVGK